MDNDFNNEKPIYLQLVEKLELSIISGGFRSGEKLPSVRDLAKEYQVNPNTMQRALAELEERGLIFTERTNGKFVTKDAQLLKIYKEKYAEERIREYFSAMRKLGYDVKDAIDYLKQKGGIN